MSSHLGVQLPCGGGCFAMHDSMLLNGVQWLKGGFESKRALERALWSMT